MSKQGLNNTLQGAVREPVRINYSTTQTPNGEFECAVFVGNKGVWFGNVRSTPVEAEKDAALTALDEIKAVKAEKELRDLLGLRSRVHLTELDHVRDQLRALRQRVKNATGITSIDRSIAYTVIGKLYQAVDRCENTIVGCTRERDT